MFEKSAPCPSRAPRRVCRTRQRDAQTENCSVVRSRSLDAAVRFADTRQLMREQAPRWVFGGVAVIYAALVLSLLPWASRPGYDAPYLIGIYGVAICAADFCTSLFLFRQY